MADNKDDSIQKNTVKRKKNDLKQNRIFTVISILAGLILIFLFIYLNINKTYTGYKVINEYERSDSNTKEYISYDQDKMIKYSCDGITAIDTEGRSIWSYSYEMKNPKAVVCEKYVAVADIGGTDVYIFDGSGKDSKIDNVSTIAQVEVSARGIVALLVEEGMADYIKISDGSTNYIDIKTRLKEDGYPLDMAFSNDSKKLVTSYTCIEEGKLTNKVTCYNLGEVGKNYESKIVAAYNYEDTMVPRVEFINKDTFALFSEHDIAVYSMKEKPSELFKTDKFESKIESIFYNDSYTGVILDDEIKHTKEIRVYSLDGKIKMKKNIDYEYDSIYMTKEDIIMYTTKDALIENLSGYTKFEGSFDMDMEYILPYNNKERFYFISFESILKVKLTEGD